jgi:hypothetical protein
VDEIYQQYYAGDFTLPNLVHTIGSGVISDSSGLVGFGMVKLYPEAIIVLDKARPKTTQGRALKLLFSEAIKACRQSGYNSLQAHTLDSDYSNLLIKHFGFEKLNSIDHLVLEIKDGTVNSEKNESIT